MARSRYRGQVGVLLAGCLLAAPALARAEPIDAVTLSVQAAYLYQFTRFVEWPAADAEAPMDICVVGRDPFGTILDQAVAGRRVGARRVAVARLPDAEGAAACDVVYLPAGEAARFPELQKVVRNAPVLLVGDAPRFAQTGGMIGFFRDADRIRFEVNPSAAEGAGLRISSRLLGIARVVSGTAVGGR